MSCIQEVYLISSALPGIVFQHCCYGAIEALAIEACCVDYFGLAGPEPEASDLGTLCLGADGGAGKGVRSVGVLHFVADILFGVISDVNDGRRGAKRDEDGDQRHRLS